jgi:hypothetical protein
MLENGEGLALLLRAKHWTACGGVVRSQLEILAAILDLKDDPEPLRRESAIYLAQLYAMKNAKEAAANSAHHHYDLPVEKHIQEIEERFPGITPTRRNVSEILKAAEPRLRQIYQHYCIETHHNLSAISSRHFRKGKVQVFEQIPDDFASQHLYWSAYCMVAPLDWFLAALNRQEEKNELDAKFAALALLLP